MLTSACTARLGAVMARPFGKALSSLRRFESIRVEVPSMGESITEGAIQTWRKRKGDFVNADEIVAIIDTDKISVEVAAPSTGVITETMAEEGDNVEVGNELFVIDTEGKESQNKDAAPAAETPAVEEAAPVSAEGFTRAEKKVAMTRMRQRIGERLKSAQSDGVLLTTFQELDMGAVTEYRKKHGAMIKDQTDVKLGFMSFFIAACARTILKYPNLNAYVEGKNLVEHSFADISIAVATPTGLVVPVVRNAEAKPLLRLEQDLLDLATKARENKLKAEDMAGGTFTISNGGVYGSLAGTPVINPPQSAILGMHGISQRAVVRNGKVVPRPIMFLALTYDHRVVDGREAVCFLKDITTLLENPEELVKEAGLIEGVHSVEELAKAPKRATTTA